MILACWLKFEDYLATNIGVTVVAGACILFIIFYTFPTFGRSALTRSPFEVPIDMQMYHKLDPTVVEQPNPIEHKDPSPQTGQDPKEVKYDEKNNNSNNNNNNNNNPNPIALALSVPIPQSSAPDIRVIDITKTTSNNQA
jgi:hypothetical protein